MFYPVSECSVSFLTVAVVAVIVLLKDCSCVAGISLAPVFWNLTNSIFKTSKNDHIIVVNLFDEIDFICPYYSSTITDSNLLEYYLIYRVSKKEYDDCNIYSENGTFLILRCTHPRQRRRFTILFEPFQSIPNVPEYKAGHTYYFMTPSTGKKNGLRNLYKGACDQHNMKLTIRVREGDYEGDEGLHKRPLNESTIYGDREPKQEDNSGKNERRILKGLLSPATETSDDENRHHLSGSSHHSRTTTNSTHLQQHGVRSPHKTPAKINHGMDSSSRRSHSNKHDSTFSDDGEENQKAFINSENKISPSSSELGRQFNKSSPVVLTPSHFLIEALLTISILLGRWSRD